MENNKKSKIKLIVLLAIILVMFIYQINVALRIKNSDETRQIANKGVIDLRSFDFDKDKMIRLDGDWEFYKDQFLTPEDFNNKSFSKNYRPIRSHLEEYGYGTYRLKVLIHKDALYSVKIGHLEDAYILWANNTKIASVGKVGRSKDETVSEIFEEAAFFYTDTGEVNLVLQVSNFHFKPRFLDSILIGEASKIHTYNERMQAFGLFVFGCSFIATLYNLAVFLRRKKDKAPLYFAIVCILIGIRTIFIGERFFTSLMPNISYELSIKVMFWSFYMYIPFLLLYINKNFNGILSRKVLKVSNFAGLVYFLIVLLFPIKAYIKFLTIFDIIALILILYVIFSLLKLFIRDGTSDYITVIGLAALFIARINDIICEYNALIISPYASIGVLIFIMANFYILSKRQAKALTNFEEASEKLRSLNNLKDDFLTITSHELQMPLNGIVGLTEEIISRNININEEDRNDLLLIKSSSKRLVNLVNDLILFSKLKNNEIKLDRKPIKINKIIDMVIKLCEPSFRCKEIEIVNLVGSGVPFIYGDENRLQHIFYNIIFNGIKYTEKGKIIISCGIVGDYLEVTVEDIGIKIAKEKISDIFDHYEEGEHVSEKHKGTGMGLYITNSLVKLHGGDIIINATDNKSAKLILTLPLTYCDEIGTREYNQKKIIEENKIRNSEGLKIKAKEINEEIHEGLNVYDNKKYKVLIVDDEFVNQKVLKYYLSSIIYNVLIASTGKEALEIIEKNKDLDLIIIDMMIPDLLGYEICSKIRKNYSIYQLPILIMTSDNRQENLVLSFESGANDYLRKPFNREELLSRVSTLLNLKRSVQDALTLAQQVTVANEKIQTLNFLNNESVKKVEELIEYDNIKTEFFANISHELRTPLNVISTTIQLLKSLDHTKNLGDDRIRYYFDIMNQNALRLIRLINNLIDTTKIDGNYLNLNLSNGDIVYVVEELVQSVADFVESKGINITFDTEVEEKIIAIDEEKIERIILNLLSNAVKFTDDGGSIFVNIYDKDDFIEISIKDTGIGIPEDKLEYIFKRFAQIDKSINRKSEGSGIGLALVKSLVEMQEGTIYAKSKLGKGSEFIITLPVRTINCEDIESVVQCKEISKTDHKESLEVEFSDIY